MDRSLKSRLAIVGGMSAIAAGLFVVALVLPEGSWGRHSAAIAGGLIGVCMLPFVAFFTLAELVCPDTAPRDEPVKPNRGAGPKTPTSLPLRTTSAPRRTRSRAA